MEEKRKLTGVFLLAGKKYRATTVIIGIEKCVNFLACQQRRGKNAILILPKQWTTCKYVCLRDEPKAENINIQKSCLEPS